MQKNENSATSKPNEPCSSFDGVNDQITTYIGSNKKRFRKCNGETTRLSCPRIIMVIQSWKIKRNCRES